MLKIRLQRFGSKNDPKFRIVLTDSKNSTKSGKFLEILGFYNPVQKEKKFNGEKIKYWISKGAKPSDTLHNLLVKEKIIEGKTINVLPSKSPIVKKDDESGIENKEAEKSPEAPTEKVEETQKEEASPSTSPEQEQEEEKPAEESKPAEEPKPEEVNPSTSPEQEKEKPTEETK